MWVRHWNSKSNFDINDRFISALMDTKGNPRNNEQIYNFFEQYTEVNAFRSAFKPLNKICLV